LSLLRRAVLAILLLAVPSLLTAAPPHRAVHTSPAHAVDWSTVANRLPSGAFVLGNPNAKVKLVEYLSLTCPHCAHFEGEAIGPLTQKYIKPGLVSYEVRHALRDAFDFSGSMLARCSGPLAFFQVLPIVYAQQDAWYARAAKWSETAPAGTIPPDQLLPMVAKGAGLDDLFAAHGLASAKAQACLTNHDEQNILTGMANEGWRRPNFPGTPAFLIDGQLQQNIASWLDIDRALAAALRNHRS
jgi:hypothetical protein